ncbi:xylose isomerase [Loktanella sp. D2R18]|uniref:DUF1045 domain-containing protein n=1 Tax=Rhodobacterales TaxID=204455 RepID=UPI000DEA76FE|nr:MULTISPECIES: DUF1045 domain-containing protein [Rhodobacterales]MDO6591073.1 DUF1045 domain-containing protein [Yoonia sp. 1_MG-2023]RBW42387.1 xylose isomerase [Loktanella sp. D2R18]
MFERYAIFYTPPPGPFADFCSAWLGWDNRTGRACPHPQIADFDVTALTQTPRKYGIHATLKAPFRLAKGCSPDDLADATGALAATLPAFNLAGLALKHHRGFLALRPRGDVTVLNAFTQAIVETLDPFRAPAPPEELARRRKANLTERQEANLMAWGYPYVDADFHFHLTLSGRIDPGLGADVTDALAPHLLPLVPRPFPINQISLMGEDAAGMFHEIHRYDLSG